MLQLLLIGAWEFSPANLLFLGGSIAFETVRNQTHCHVLYLEVLMQITVRGHR